MHALLLVLGVCGCLLVQAHDSFSEDDATFVRRDVEPLAGLARRAPVYGNTARKLAGMSGRSASSTSPTKTQAGSFKKQQSQISQQQHHHHNQGQAHDSHSLSFKQKDHAITSSTKPTLHRQGSSFNADDLLGDSHRVALTGGIQNRINRMSRTVDKEKAKAAKFEAEAPARAQAQKQFGDWVSSDHSSIQGP